MTMGMRLSEIVAASARVTEASGRLAKIGHLADALRQAGPGEALLAVGLLTGVPRQGRIGIGFAQLRQARAEPASAEPTLTLAEVDATFERLLAIRGKGAAGERLRELQKLFGRATEAEQDFLVRLLVGELRQGALEGVMVEAVARAAGLPAADVRRAVMLAGDLGVVAEAALDHGAAGLARFAVQLFRPVQPMLAQPAEDAEDALKRLGEAAFEWKLDGARVQVHKRGDEVRVFTRKLNEVTAAVPEIVEIARALPARELILDGEAIALRAGGRPQPFQITMRRFGRKLDVEAMRAELPLRCFFFDALALDGETLIDRPGRERAAALDAALPGELRIPRIVTRRLEDAEEFVKGALEQGHEGAMAKALDAPYEAGRRGAGWLKVKRAHTLDLAILAAEWGHGRRRGFLSNLHLGAYDPAQNGFVMLGKTFKGLTDQMLAWQTEKLLQLEIGRDDYTVYVRPELVVEIAYNDLQASPHYPGGLALRFARVKAYREDKRAKDADTIDTVRALFAAQGQTG
jgi:ATP-dependent DNA ligase I